MFSSSALLRQRHACLRYTFLLDLLMNSPSIALTWCQHSPGLFPVLHPLYSFPTLLPASSLRQTFHRTYLLYQRKRFESTVDGPIQGNYQVQVN